jgi:hypothetical protein
MNDLSPQDQRRPRPWHDRAFWFWVAIATLIAAGLRLYNLDAAGFWLDELYTIYVTADMTITHNSKMFGYIPTWLGFWASGINPADIPQANLDSSAWRQMGITHASARLGSAGVGILTVPLIAWACRRMLGGGTAVMVAFLLATSPWHIYWSQASRFYSFQFLFYTMALVLYFSATRDRSRPLFAGSMACIVLAFLSQPTALAIMAIFGVDWLIAHARRRPLQIGPAEWAMGIGTVGVCAAILLSDVYRAPEEWAQFVSFGGAEYQPPHKLGMGAVYMTGPAVVLAALASAWMMRRTEARLSIYLLTAALLPIAIFAAWSIGNFVGLRYLLVSLFGWLALAAIGLDRLATDLYRRGQGLLIAMAPLAVLIASSGYLLLGYYTNAYGFHPRWPEAYAYVARHAAPGDVIACRHPIVGRYYLERPDIEFLPLNADELAAMGQRVWLVVESESTVEQDIGPWIFKHAELKQSLELSIPRPISRVMVLLYERPPEVDEAP